MRKLVKVKRGAVDKGIEEIRKTLLDFKVPNKQIAKTLLASEDVLIGMFEHGKSEAISVRLYSSLGNVNVRMFSRGTAFSLKSIDEGLAIEADDDDARAVIDRYMSKILGENIDLSNHYGVNGCRIKVSKSKYASVIKALCALLLGILVGQIIKMVLPEALALGISRNIFSTISTMFMNALKLIVGPLVFLSIASSVADFSDLAALGKLAIKVVVGFVLTSMIAILIGLVTSKLFPIGDPSLAALISNGADSVVASGQAMDISIRETIVNIIPSDLISPFKNSDMLQIIFLGVLLGLAIAALAERHPEAKQTVISLYDIVCKITAMIIFFLPIAVFCSMAKMAIEMDFTSLVKIAVWIPVCVIGFIFMIIAYLIILLVVGRLNPIKFLKAFSPAIITAFSLGSSNATMPASMKLCEEKLGISKRISSFTIPLGTTINMDGSCVNLIISVMFMANIFGVTIDRSLLTVLIISTLVLSMGAPGVPGAALVCLSILLPQMGIPADGISIIMGVYTIVGMAQTCVNVTGDAVIATIIARLDNQIDLDVYNAN